MYFYKHKLNITYKTYKLEYAHIFKNGFQFNKTNTPLKEQYGETRKL